METINSNFSQRWPISITRLASIITIILAGFTLLGRLLYYWIGQNNLSIVLLFQPNAAICFILSGIVLWDCSKKQEQHPIIKIFSAIVFLIGFLTLFEYFFNINLGIDELIFKAQAKNSVLPSGRMPPLTALNFILLSFSLFFIDNRVINHRIYTTLILILLTISTFELLLYFYTFASQNNEILVTIFQMHFLSAFLFTLLGIGILFARPYRGFISVLISENTSGKLARRLILPAIIFPVLFGYIYISGNIEKNAAFKFSGIVLSIFIFITCLILVNTYLINKREKENNRNALTQQKKIKNELQKTKKLTIQLSEEADEANRAKNAFLTAMSHEIRTPLNGAMGAVELLYDTHLSEEQKSYLAMIRHSGENLLKIINDIIDYARIESGRFELEFSDFNLQSLLDDTIEKVVSKVQEKNLTMNATIDPDIPDDFHSDPSRIRQILLYLLDNAIKFTDKGEITIAIKLIENQESSNSKLLFEVIDTGSGVHPEIAKRLFKPFSQGDFSDKRKYGGTGLGLVISKKLVEMLNGTIGIESTPGVGSKFWFILPLKVCLVAEEKKYEKLSEYEGTRILCVDDNPMSREIMERQIRSWSLNCDVSSNAGQALSQLLKGIEEKTPYKLVLIDYLMPEMNGLELIKIVRRLSELNQTNIIILSPTGASFGLEEMKKLNIIMCLTKPFRKDMLYEGIKVSLQKIYSNQNTHAYTTVAVKNITPSILLAEDNDVSQEIALRMLNKLGYQIDVVNNGKEVLKAIKNKFYDIILMDCQMPEVDGYTATQEIRQLETNQEKKTIIIAMTAHALKGDKNKCLQAGMDDYIAKPIDSITLSSTLQKWLGQVSAHPPEITSPPTNQNATEIINMTRINEIFGDENSAIQQFLQTFITSTTNLLAELQEAIKQEDKALSKELFHRLKGSAANSGMTQLHQLALSGEQKIIATNWEAANTIYTEIITAFNHIKNKANEMIKLE